MRDRKIIVKILCAVLPLFLIFAGTYVNGFLHPNLPWLVYDWGMGLMGLFVIISL